MASQVVPDPGLLPYAGGGALGLLGVLAGFFQARRKADVDESANVLKAWKELFEGHQNEMRALKSEFAEYKLTAQKEFNQYKIATEAEITGLRQRIGVLEGDLAKERDKSAGLVRQLAQHSQSTALLIKPNPAIDDDAAKLERAGDNIRKAGK